MAESKAKRPRVRRFAGLLLVLCLLLIVILWLGLNSSSERPMASAPMQHEGDACLSGIQDPLKTLDTGGRLRVLVWNIHKQGDGNWPAALASQRQGADLLLLQEVQLNSAIEIALCSADLSWLHLSAFNLLSTAYGVMNAAVTAPLRGCGFLAVEPWIRLQKSALSAIWALSNGQQLLAINVHGINFDLQLNAWQRQMQALAERIAAHQGPVIFAGDFNSWSDARTRELRRLVAELGLQSVTFEPDQRTLVLGWPLDHLYYRGLTVQAARAQTTTDSDHAPLWAQFQISP